MPFASRPAGRHLGVDRLGHVAHRGLGDLLRRARGGQLMAHRIQRRGAPLALPGRLGLKLHVGGQRADRHGRGQHHGEREQVLRILHSERETGGTKKKSNAATLKTDARIDGPRPNRVAIDDHAQQVDHDQVRRRQMPSTTAASSTSVQPQTIKTAAKIGVERRSRAAAADAVAGGTSRRSPLMT